jgi:hypothetical protein
MKQAVACRLIGRLDFVMKPAVPVAVINRINIVEIRPVLYAMMIQQVILKSKKLVRLDGVNASKNGLPPLFCVGRTASDGMESDGIRFGIFVLITPYSF